MYKQLGTNSRAAALTYSALQHTAEQPTGDCQAAEEIAAVSCSTLAGLNVLMLVKIHAEPCSCWPASDGTVNEHSLEAGYRMHACDCRSSVQDQYQPCSTEIAGGLNTVKRQQNAWPAHAASI